MATFALYSGRDCVRPTVVAVTECRRDYHMESKVSLTPLQKLNAWFEREQREHGLIEMTFCPGSDREVSEQDAAAVALSMIEYAASN